jgi:hypothetical protein
MIEVISWKSGLTEARIGFEFAGGLIFVAGACTKKNKTHTSVSKGEKYMLHF